jgi:uncharacterized protein involved in cysteine biosynthesis
VIFADFGKAVAQIGDPRFTRVLLLGIGLTVALLIGSYAGLLALIEWLTAEPVTLPLVGEVTWLGDLLSWGSVFFMVVLSVFLMIPVASAITSMFLEDVAAAVEAKHYPDLPKAPGTPFFEALRDTLGFLAVLILANLLAFALYALLPPLAPLIFYGMNGYLLGREYFTIAAMRRIGRRRAKALRRENWGQVWVAGTLMALPLTFPVLNLVIPILGAATFTHLYHRIRLTG